MTDGSSVGGNERTRGLRESYLELVCLLSAATRGQGDADLVERELEQARDAYERELFAHLSRGPEDGPLADFVSLLAKQLLDYPPLVEDPIAGELESMVAAILEQPDEAARQEGRKLSHVLARLRDLALLRPPLGAVTPAPEGAGIEKLLEVWPERPTERARDLRQRALSEYHKARQRDRRARHRAASALLDLALATSWQPFHPWRLALLERTEELADDLAEVSYQRARHLKAYGELAASRRACRRALDLDGRHLDALVFLGNLLEYSARPREALDAYERVLRLEDRDGAAPGPRGGRRRRPGRVGAGKPSTGASGAFGRFGGFGDGERRAVVAALEGCARLRILQGDPGGSLEAMLEVVRQVPGETRTLRALERLAARAGAEGVRGDLVAELERRGGSPGGPPPPGWERLDDQTLHRLVVDQVQL